MSDNSLITDKEREERLADIGAFFCHAQQHADKGKLATEKAAKKYHATTAKAFLKEAEKRAKWFAHRPFVNLAARKFRALKAED